jgi:hypothetical protein
MRTPRNIATLVAFSLLLATPSFAESNSATMSVSAQVIARAVVSVDATPSQIEVTTADIDRGYVDVAAPIVVHVRTNSRRGYLLQANNMSESFSRVELSDSTSSMNVTSESWIQRPYVAGGDVMPLHARLHLAKGVTPGSHAMPVAFSATPL